MPNSNIDYESTLLLYFSVKCLIITLCCILVVCVYFLPVPITCIGYLFIHFFSSVKYFIVWLCILYLDYLSFFILIIFSSLLGKNVWWIFVKTLICVGFRSVVIQCLSVLSVCLSVAVCELLLLHAAPKHDVYAYSSSFATTKSCSSMRLEMVPPAACWLNYREW